MADVGDEDKQDKDIDVSEGTPIENSTPEPIEAPQSLDSEESGLPSEPVKAESLDYINAKPEQESKYPKQYKMSLFDRLKKKINIYIFLFGLIIVLAVVVAVVAYSQSKNQKSAVIKSQNLTQSNLDQLANNDVTVGNSNNILSVESSAVFAGQVLVKQSLDVAGNLVIGGTFTSNGLNISGTSQFDEVKIAQDLAVSGNSTIQGSSTVSKTLQVNGSGTFNGALSAPQITTSALQINGDLVLSHHITSTGGIPTRSSGSALGSGGSVSVNGSDTAGSVTINTGSSTIAGCFATINFTNSYSTIPYVIVTPVGVSSGGLSYYINKTSSGFSICDSSTPPSGASFGFDYFVIG